METLVLPAVVVSIVIAIVGALLSRAINGVDKRAESIELALGKLTEKLANNGESIVELRVRMMAAEAIVSRQQERIDRLEEMLSEGGR